VAATPATTPAITTAQTASTASTSRIGARGGPDPEAECLPLNPETDVLTTIRSRAWLAPPGRPAHEASSRAA